MSAIVETLADKLAQDTIAAAEEIGDGNLIDEVSRLIGATSQTSQEIFMTAVRVRLALRRGHELIERKVAAAKASGKVIKKMDLSSRKIMNIEDDGAAGH